MSDVRRPAPGAPPARTSCSQPSDPWRGVAATTDDARSHCVLPPFQPLPCLPAAMVTMEMFQAVPVPPLRGVKSPNCSCPKRRALRASLVPTHDDGAKSPSRRYRRLCLWPATPDSPFPRLPSARLWIRTGCSSLGVLAMFRSQSQYARLSCRRPVRTTHRHHRALSRTRPRTRTFPRHRQSRPLWRRRAFAGFLRLLCDHSSIPRLRLQHSTRPATVIRLLCHSISPSLLPQNGSHQPPPSSLAPQKSHSLPLQVCASLSAPSSRANAL